MMVTSEIYYQNKQIENFLSNLQAIVKLADSPIHLFTLYGKVISSLFLSKIYLFLFKTLFSFLTVIPTNQETGKKIYDTACQIRDYFVESVHICQVTSSLFPFRKAIEHAAIDWDDFIEDCVIASDPELHNLLEQLTLHV